MTGETEATLPLAGSPLPDAATADLAHWQRVKELFVAVLEQERTAREAALRALAGDDAEAADEVRSLLRRYEQASSSFLDRPTLAGVLADEELADATGRTFGGYQLEALLGRGGMGTVYRAVRLEDGKRVAVKLLRWRGDPALLAAQVRAERRILAALEHDNIARLIDGGVSAEGLPFFTVELVEGHPIVAYCRARELSLRARLELFCRVCTAVAYAHRRLVIHCDLKPANILVTAAGVPKLLDFGIARLLAPGGEGEVDAGEPALASGLTPEYAAPEQVRGEEVTTATDVYALGLLLYELLTDERAQPMALLSLDEVRRVVCARVPPPPSEVAAPPRRRQLRGDLDAIVARALAKEPASRYGSARELAEDVARHLDLHPVLARSERGLGGAAYRGFRFLRRHRVAFAASALVLASLLGGIVAARREAERAGRRFAEVRALAGSFLFEVHDAIRGLPGATTARRLVVTKALEYLDRLAAEAGDDLELVHELALAYQRVGDVQGYSANANLGDTPGAAASFRKTVALAERLVAAEPGDPAARLTLAEGLERLGTTLRMQGEAASASELLGRARLLLDGLLAERADDGRVVHVLHVVHVRLGQLAQSRGDLDGALESYRAARQVNERYLALAPDDRRARRDLSVALSFAAGIVSLRDPVRGLELYTALLPPAIALAEAEPTNVELQRDLMVGYEDVAQMHHQLGHFELAIGHHGEALRIAERLLAADPENVQARQDLSIRHAQLGDVQLAKDDLEAALASYRRALALDAEVAARDPGNLRAAEFLGWSHLNVAGVLARLDRQQTHAEAADHFRQALAVATPFAVRDPADADLATLLADGHSGLGESLLALAPAGSACPPAAKVALEKAVALWDGLALEPGPDREHRDAVVARLAACDRRGRG